MRQGCQFEYYVQQKVLIDVLSHTLAQIPNNISVPTKGLDFHSKPILINMVATANGTEIRNITTTQCKSMKIQFRITFHLQCIVIILE